LAVLSVLMRLYFARHTVNLERYVLRDKQLALQSPRVSLPGGPASPVFLEKSMPRQEVEVALPVFFEKSMPRQGVEMEPPVFLEKSMPRQGVAVAPGANEWCNVLIDDVEGKC
jgi:hypothetical protein